MYLCLNYDQFHDAAPLKVLTTGLSLRGGGRGFSPATMNIALGYFHTKIEEK